MALGKHVMLLLCHLLLLLLLKAHSRCPKSYPCGNFTLQFPFTVSNDPDCGLYLVDGCDSAEGTPTLRTRAPYQILRKTSTNAFLIHDREIQESLDSSMCYTFIYLDLPESPFVSFTFSPNITFFTCYNQTALPQIQDYFQSYRRSRCEIPTIYYKPPPAHQDHALPTPPDCVLSRLPYKSGNISADPLHLLTADFTLEWSVHQDCYECHHGGGQCYSDNQRQFYCRKKVGRRRQKKEARL
ncbi:LEAF RUST 10 DISEASE-RESISTANCE LOCUS RECEPTOR-LIKE PROTEIN KINASE-like 1.1 isoform X2 [Salvia splendens]|uniref:LEAF RUST 10 DISEASE-RESISTANCE LOCUS RECEPTOR-LIKE PROTEIN KINASE-like 1.1 isoform X2 n=1 Tax=Salvia splendens TaxID=180675 RepID=UPI001C25F455|nr:LEAF RUST 10 DISEASE-RESISTANCE LOCUS RECEPTOR-LIKE PROTEIN KINASE-like 1.1 isoform X2 [Salvia splendens]